MKCYIVDAFAERLFEGNPAAVCVLDEWISAELMQNIAIENNLSETAFVVKQDNEYKLRWFTPGGEIDLCGHATLASAFVITAYYEPFMDIVQFQTMSGMLVVEKQENLFEMTFPSQTPAPCPLTEEMVDALDIKPVEAYLGRDLMLVLEDEKAVQNATPDFLKL
ncbi:PhzF family phenazine biosynthesis protein [Aureibacillus halotolerans]|uniref:PhzF family phenazine biosynthesis protein n=1 Tax=Aureibacillus halotolerans TaxID=1508390 RepID=A0A4R6TXQ5_9BACI|nr:PhzF family phenazine biosynthesis protein [Aureibacillus halotolerans]